MLFDRINPGYEAKKKNKTYTWFLEAFTLFGLTTLFLLLDFKKCLAAAYFLLLSFSDIPLFSGNIKSSDRTLRSGVSDLGNLCLSVSRETFVFNGWM